MIKIPEHSIILAPANLHMVLYQKILEQKENCLDIQVITLTGFLTQFFPIQEDIHLAWMYQAKAALCIIPETNAFFLSCKESDFLQSCYSFLSWYYTYNLSIQDLPETSQKEKDLKEILTPLLSLSHEYKEANYATEQIKKNTFDNVYILAKEYTDLEFYWIQLLLDQGAHILQSDSQAKKHYYACANIAKQAKIVAKWILDNNWKAEDLFISVDSPAEEQSFIQALRQHKIPFTKLSTPGTSSILQEWIACLEWILNKDISSFIKLMESLYPSMASKFDTYYSLFPEAFKTHQAYTQIAYQPNEFIDASTFNSYQNLEIEVIHWLQEHKALLDWNFQNLTEIAQTIQEQHETIEKEDFILQNKIQTLCAQAYPYLKETKDLILLKDAIASLSMKQKANTIQGAIIGKRSDYCALRPICIILGANTEHFPNLSLQSGIFDESYFSKLPLPSLAERIERQRTQIFDTIGSCEDLYCLVPQSDYQGKNKETSLELNNWMQIPCTFINIEESSIYEIPKFNIKNPKELFFPNQTFRGSVSRLESFAKCPLQHFLRYGLKLKEIRDFTDIRTKGSILHHILEQVTQKYPKDYANIPYEELHTYVSKEFEFVSKLFPQQVYDFQNQIASLTTSLSLLFEQFSVFEKNWHMQPSYQEYKIEKSWKWENYTIELIGYVDRIDTSNSSFCIFDYKSSDKELKLDDFESGISLQLATYTIFIHEKLNKIPVGNFYISLKNTPMSQEAVKLAYRKVDWIEQEEKDLIEKYPDQKQFNGWAYQDLSTYCDEEKRFKTKKDALSFNRLQEEWQEIIANILHDIESGNISCQHVAKACDYCAYSSICRQAKTEVEKTCRIQKED